MTSDYEWQRWSDPGDAPPPSPVDTVVYDFATEALAMNPDAFYRLGDESGTVMTDSGPNGHHGSYVGAVTLDQPGLLTADSDPAITLPGVATAYASIPYGAWLNRATLGFGIWFATTAAVTQYLAQRWGTIGADQVFGLDLSGANQVRAYVRVAGSNKILTVTPATNCRDGQRHFLFATWDGATLILYLDGVVIGTLAAAGAIQANTSLGIRLGVRHDATGPFAGKLDEFWFGPAVSPEQVAYLYEIGATGAPAVDPATILVGYGADGWDWRQVASSNATDYSLASSGWTAGGETPFGGNRSGIVTAWAANTRLWVQRDLPGLATLTVTVKVEDNATVYVNGTQIGTTGIAGAGATHLTPTTFVAPTGILDPDGPNVVAIRADDEYGDAGGSDDQTFLDVQITGTLPAPDGPTGWETDDDRTAGLIAWAATYGRADSNARATPLQVTVELAASRAGTCPTIGDRFRLALSDARAAVLGLDEDQAVRFTGEVTDARVDPNRKPGGVYTITGIGRLGRASRRRLTPKWPEEDDGNRVNRILTAASVDVGTIDPGTVDLLPALTAATAGQLLDRVVDSTLGQVIEQPTGLVDWHDAEHRRDTPVTVELAASEIVNDLDWSQHVGDIINDVTVTYGNPQDTVRAYDPTSIDERDAYPGSLSTDLVTASDAHSLGTLVVARRREPSWQLPALVIDLLRTVDDVKLAQLLTLRHGDRIRVAEFPAGGPYAGVVELFVEGWSESLVRIAPKNTQKRWRLALAVSDPALSGVGLRWMDVPADLTWGDVDPTLTWLDVATLDNPTDLGT